MDSVYSDAASFGRTWAYWSAVVISIIAICAASYGIYLLLAKQNIAVAVVLSDSVPTTIDKNNLTYFTTNMQWIVDNKIYNSQMLSTNKYNAGAFVNVYYTNDPQNASEYDDKTWAYGLIYGSMGVTAFAWIWVWILSKSKFLAAGAGAADVFRLASGKLP